MKSIFKLTLVLAVAILACNSAFGQKFGFVDTREVLDAMPEMETVTKQLTDYEEELAGMLESIQVEYNNKYLDYQRGLSTFSDSMRQLKEKELQDLQTRYAEFNQTAQQEMNRMQAQLFQPVIEKARTAIENVSRAQGMTAVFDLSAGALVYHDPAEMIDILPLVKTELGIQ